MGRRFWKSSTIKAHILCSGLQLYLNSLEDSHKQWIFVGKPEIFCSLCTVVSLEFQGRGWRYGKEIETSRLLSDVHLLLLFNTCLYYHTVDVRGTIEFYGDKYFLKLDSSAWNLPPTGLYTVRLLMGTTSLECSFGVSSFPFRCLSDSSCNRNKIRIFSAVEIGWNEMQGTDSFPR